MELNKLVRSIGQIIKNAALCTGAYALFLAGGTFLLLVVVSAIGYLPYSDRPGPGWFAPQIPHLQEVGFYAGWATFLLGPFALVWGVLLFVLVRALGWLATPKWLVRVFSGMFASFVSLFGVAAAGWYIAIASAAVYGGAGIGLLFGSWILPRFAGEAGQIKNVWLRSAGVAAMLVGSVGVVIYPLLPDPDAQSLDVQFERLIPGSEEISLDSGLTKDEVAVLNSLGLKGQLRDGIQLSSSGGGKRAHALIVIRNPLNSKVTLREPRAVNVVYIQDDTGVWRMYPNDAPTMRKKITLVEGTGDHEGLIVEVEPKIGSATSFTWYPPIKRQR